MGTHPIFESDFDCLTVCRRCTISRQLWTAERRSAFPATLAIPLWSSMSRRNEAWRTLNTKHFNPFKSLMPTKKKVFVSLPSLATNSASKSQRVTRRSQNLLKSTISRASFSRKSKSMAKMRILCGPGWKQHPTAKERSETTSSGTSQSLSSTVLARSLTEPPRLRLPRSSRHKSKNFFSRPLNNLSLVRKLTVIIYNWPKGRKSSVFTNLFSSFRSAFCREKFAKTCVFRIE